MPDEGDKLVEILAAMAEADKVILLRQYVADALAVFDIQAAYFLAPLGKDPRVGRVLTNLGFPKVWERHYRARLHLVDPLPGLSLEFGNAFVWPDDLPSEKLEPRQKRYMEIAAQYGFAKGIGVACYGPRGRAGFLGVQWNREDPPGQRVLQAVHQIGQTSFQQYCQIILDIIDFEPLSNRELEVLGWMCDGKSNPDIATAIGVSRSTVDAYIRRIFSKLGVNDRTAACVRAYSCGILVSEEVQRMSAKMSEE